MSWRVVIPISILLTSLVAFGVYRVITDDLQWEEMDRYADTGNIKGIDLMLKRGIPVDIDEHESHETALWVAAGRENVECVNYLLMHGASVKSIDAYRHATPLACAYNPNIIELLVMHGADPNAVASDTKYSALDVCAEHDYQSTAIFLLQHGANPIARDAQGDTPAMVAELSGHSELATMLKTAEVTWKQSR